MTDPNFNIETPRLFISYFLADNPKHCQFLYEMYNSALFVEYNGKTSITDAEKAQERIGGRFVEEHQRNGYGNYLVSLKQSPDNKLTEAEPIGSVSLMKGDTITAPDIGYSIIPEFNGKGYATEAGKALIEYAKTKLGVENVFGFLSVKNLHSKRVMEKLGLEFRGEMKLKNFGGAESFVYATPGMGKLEHYNVYIVD
jgi:RimJ/RimL family protein N-acetyltransferase